MNRPSRITSLLIGTGVPPFAFTAAVFLVPIPDDVFRYLVFPLLIVPLIIFLPTLAYFGSRDVFRRAVGTRQQILLVASKCAICDVPLPAPELRELRQVQGPHYASVHPDYWEWSQRWRMIGIVILAPVIFVMALGVYGLIMRNYTMLILSILFVGSIEGGFFLFQKRRQQRFRAVWRRAQSG